MLNPSWIFWFNLFYVMMVVCQTWYLFSILSYVSKIWRKCYEQSCHCKFFCQLELIFYSDVLDKYGLWCHTNNSCSWLTCLSLSSSSFSSSPTAWTAPPPSASEGMWQQRWPLMIHLEMTRTSPRTTWMRLTSSPRRPSLRPLHLVLGQNQEPSQWSWPTGLPGGLPQDRADLWAESQPIRVERTRLGSAATTEGMLGYQAESLLVSSEQNWQFCVFFFFLSK